MKSNNSHRSTTLSTLINLGNFELTTSQISVLNKGLGFVHTPEQIQSDTILHSLSDFERRMLIQYYFATHPSKQKLEPFRAKSRWIPPVSECENIEKYLQKVENDLIKLRDNTKGNPDNLTHNEIKALSELRANKNIIIKRADKGGRIVLWPRNRHGNTVSPKLC